MPNCLGTIACQPVVRSILKWAPQSCSSRYRYRATCCPPWIPRTARRPCGCAAQRCGWPLLSCRGPLSNPGRGASNTPCSSRFWLLRDPDGTTGGTIRGLNGPGPRRGHDCRPMSRLATPSVATGAGTIPVGALPRKPCRTATRRRRSTALSSNPQPIPYEALMRRAP